MEIPARIGTPGRFLTVDDNPDDELAFPTLSENVHGIVRISFPIIIFYQSFNTETFLLFLF